MNPDNKRLAFIEGGTFERPEYGDDRTAVIAYMKMPDGFKLSARSMIVVEVEEWDALRASNKDLLEAAKAYQELAICYRTGKRPTEKLFSRLEKAKTAIAESEPKP